MFTHLHVHSEFSLLDGMSHVPQLVARAKELGMDAIALTDHGVMYGAIQFYQAAKEAGIKPIIGCEVYIAPGSRFNKEANGKRPNHLVLLAKDLTGYRNLIQLCTKAQLEGYYYKPRVDKELLEKYHEGLLALSACPSGEVPQLILEGRYAEAQEAALWYRETFTDFYLEVQRHPMPEIEQINKGLITLSRETGIPIVATNDIHYTHREDSSTHDLLLCIGTNTTIYDEKRMKMGGDFFYLKSPQEMEEAYKDIPESIENTQRIAAMCNLELEFGRRHLPEIELAQGKSADDFLAELCREGLPMYYPNPSSEIKQRLECELDVIKKTEFANYFLVVWDIISFVKQNNILFGVRGSAAASIVLHCLGITEIDPIKNKLVFERFLNLERREMPDIDLDFADDRRDEVIDYVAKKYGQDHVAQIITFGTLGARAALRDVGRALGMSYGDVDRVARLVPFAVGMTLDRALSENSELKTIYQEDAVVKNLIDSAKKVEGISRHASTHAAGVVIAREPLTNNVPLQLVAKGDSAGAVMTQFTMEDIARIGLLKMDFLGLANLTILGKARDLIKKTCGRELDLHKLPFNNKRTFDLLSSGETAGVFQLEGSGMRRYIKDLKPTIFSDIAAMVALYRPGPMEHIPTYIQAKHNPSLIKYPHPALEGILKETYGVIVYQEQVLFIVQAVAGYSLGQADIFRKAMGKKIVEVMKKQKTSFIAGAKERGFPEEIAGQIFALIEPFAGYAFNKAHAFSYALIAYQTAYLKANFPVEYMTAFLITFSGNTEKVAGAVTECQRLHIKVLPPDINSSQASFSIEKVKSEQAIRFGLTAIKNVGQGAIEPIIAEREKGGKFSSIDDFCRRCDLRNVNRRVLESLIKAGAMDSLGDRASMLYNAERILSMAQREQRLRETGQSTMFDLFGQAVATPVPKLEMGSVAISPKEKLLWEKELMGVYLSEHPFRQYAGKSENTILCGQIDDEMVGQTVRVAGMVASVHLSFTRDRQSFASAVLEDLTGSIEVMVWPKIYANTKELWEEGNVLLVGGRLRSRDDRLQLSCDSVEEFNPETASASPPPSHVASAKSVRKPVEVKSEATAPAPAPGCCLIITLDQTEDESADAARLRQVMQLLKDYPGQDAVKLRISNDERITNLRANLTVGYCPELHQKIEAAIGSGSLMVAGR